MKYDDYNGTILKGISIARYCARWTAPLINVDTDLVVVGVVERLDIEEHRISIVLARLGTLGRLLCQFGRKPQVTEKFRYSSGYPLLRILLLQCPVYTHTVHLR